MTSSDDASKVDWRLARLMFDYFSLLPHSHPLTALFIQQLFLTTFPFQLFFVRWTAHKEKSDFFLLPKSALYRGNFLQLFWLSFAAFVVFWRRQIGRNLSRLLLWRDVSSKVDRTISGVKWNYEKRFRSNFSFGCVIFVDFELNDMWKVGIGVAARLSMSLTSNSHFECN